MIEASFMHAYHQIDLSLEFELEYLKSHDLTPTQQVEHQQLLSDFSKQIDQLHDHISEFLKLKNKLTELPTEELLQKMTNEPDKSKWLEIMIEFANSHQLSEDST
jgi:DNA-binding ferritin-like protein